MDFLRDRQNINNVILDTDNKNGKFLTFKDLDGARYKVGEDLLT